MINKIEPRKEESLTDDEKLERQEKFKKENESLMKKFAMFKKFDDSHQFLLKHPHLTCKETLNYLTIWCINLEVEGKKELMNHVAHQIIIMQFIMTIAHEADPRNFITAFFWRIKSEDELHINIFNEELEAFKQRVRTRAQLKIEEDLVEKEERQKRLGPGGLDPVEVFDSLPGILKECFEKKDMAMLMKAVRTLTREESEYHMLRCIASGLWIPDEEEGENVNARTDSDDRENIYKGA